MKKFIIIMLMLLFAVVSLISQPKPTNAAESQYAMVVTENACFYSDASRQFVKYNLPYSYFVRVIAIGVDFSRVAYMDDSSSHPSSEGYVSNIDLNFTIEPNSSPYPKLTLIVKSDEVLFSDTTKTQPKTVINASQEATFYGKITVGGESYLYVYTQGYIGYVRESAFYTYDLPNHPSVHLLEQPKGSTSVEDEEPAKDTSGFLNFSNSTKTAVIAIMVIASLCLIYFILRPDKKPSREHSFFNDRDDFY